MRILYFLSAFPVISETFVLSQITGLIDLGHEVDISALSIGDLDVVHADVERYALLEKLTPAGDSYDCMPVQKLARLWLALRIFCTASAAHKRVYLRCLNVFRYKRDAWTLCLFFRAWQMQESGKNYDVVHCHFGHNGSRAAALKGVGALDAAVVATFHGHDVTQDVIERGPDTYNLLFELGSRFLPVSYLWQQELLKLGCPEQKLQVHRMGINATGLQSNQHGAGDGAVILTVARLVEKKGLCYALQAMHVVLQSHANTQYIIAGDGPLRAEIEQHIRQLQIQDNVRLLGWQDQRQIDTLMSQADIFLLPSVTASNGDKEGVPVVLMEAMARAIPVVSTLHSGIPELVEEGVSGFLLPEADAQGLSSRILELLADPALRADMGQCGREKVLSEFNAPTLNASLAATFADLCKLPSLKPR